MNEFVYRVKPCGEIEQLERIVRCIECKRCFDINKDTHWCAEWDRETGLYEFCSFAERKDDDG